MFGRDEHKKLEARRREVLSAISGTRLTFEVMVQRAQQAGDTPDEGLLTQVRSRLEEFEQSATQATNVDDLNDILANADQQVNLRAYVCPSGEIGDEARLTLDQMEEWGVPKAVIAKLRGLLVQKAEQRGDLKAARSALRFIFEESDSWDSYTTEYEETMNRRAYWLFGATIVLSVLAMLAFRWSDIALIGLFLAGAAGSCVSVLTKMPMLDVSLSGELSGYDRRIISRICAGTTASLIGSALLGWGLLPISIQHQTFTDALKACTTSPGSCTGLPSLILLGVPMLLGFSERALTSFERQLFGNSKTGVNKRRNSP